MQSLALFFKDAAAGCEAQKKKSMIDEIDLLIEVNGRIYPGPILH